MAADAVSVGPPIPSDQTAAGTLPEFWPMRLFAERPELPRGDDQAVKRAATQLLDEALVNFKADRWRDGMQLQHDTVRLARNALSAESWSRFAKVDCIAHPICQILHQDPFTFRSYNKPRGYAGDAVLIDYIYGTAHAEHALDEATPLGRWICNYASNTMAPRAVRRRMYLIAELIDLVCAERRDARILSIASGHMRELLISHAYRAGVLGNAVAFDQDEASLAELSENIKSRSLRCERGSVSRLIVGRHNFSDFDLVYASGLFDYLEDKAAKRLTETMFSMLRPGGRLLIANFLPGIYDLGYMESFMGWDLIYRDRNQIVSLVAGLDPAERQCSYFEESERNIGFLLVKKTAQAGRSASRN
jgi:extracellular factor (EF) 3-hydroxypalmitic acid methyl ester biosynthesis protein